ncbi:hypothetical protein [Sinorhizobium meliloti]|uniref:hypothetical protein n=1 Tax=Rhizobium meliloti TaxID=382 RepID=UPI0013E39392|nr:hypothetical protein [Sinorhizobium meliloti]
MAGRIAVVGLAGACAAPLLNNIPAYDLGLIAFFASHLTPGQPTFLAAVVKHT